VKGFFLSSSHPDRVCGPPSLLPPRYLGFFLRDKANGTWS